MTVLIIGAAMIYPKLSNLGFVKTTYALAPSYADSISFNLSYPHENLNVMHFTNFSTPDVEDSIACHVYGD